MEGGSAVDDLGEKINSILSDPDQMGKIAQMAKSIMGGAPEQAAASAPPEEPGLDPAMLGRIASILGKSGGASSKRPLLEAMRPYLSEKRRNKMDKALQIAKLAAIAEAAIAEFGKDGQDV